MRFSQKIKIACSVFGCLFFFLALNSSNANGSIKRLSSLFNPFPNYINIQHSDDGVSTYVNFKVNDREKEDIKISVYTIPDMKDHSVLIYPSNWKGHEADVTIEYRRENSFPSSIQVILVIEMQNFNNDKRTWSVGFQH